MLEKVPNARMSSTSRLYTGSAGGVEGGRCVRLELWALLRVDVDVASGLPEGRRSFRSRSGAGHLPRCFLSPESSSSDELSSEWSDRLRTRHCSFGSALSGVLAPLPRVWADRPVVAPFLGSVAGGASVVSVLVEGQLLQWRTTVRCSFIVRRALVAEQLLLRACGPEHTMRRQRSQLAAACSFPHSAALQMPVVGAVPRVEGVEGLVSRDWPAGGALASSLPRSPFCFESLMLAGCFKPFVGGITGVLVAGDVGGTAVWLRCCFVVLLWWLAAGGWMFCGGGWVMSAFLTVSRQSVHT